MAGPTFLIVRGEDFVVLAVEWAGCEVRTDAHAAAPRLVATGTDPTVTLTFPPQAILEQATPAEFHTTAAVHSHSWLSEPSRLVFRVATGTVIELTAQGILDALARPGQAHIDGQASGIELPWGLTVLPLARTTGAQVLSDHRTRPVPVAGSGAVGLWTARLRAGDAGATDALLAIRPTSFRDTDAPPSTDGPFQKPPLRGQRQAIVTSSAQDGPPDATRLELTALGGTLSAGAQWPSLTWTHEATVGRDQRADVTVSGKLWPFGFSCVYQDFTRREFLPRYDPAAAGCVAALRRQRTLVISRPLLTGTRAPTFPFDEVELLGCEFSLTGTTEPTDFLEFLPGGPSSPVRFPVRCRAGGTTVQFTIPLVFVSDTRPGPSQAVVDSWRPFAKAPVPGVALDLVGAGGRPGDVQEVRSLTFTAAAHGTGYRPDLAGFDVVLSALRTLLPGSGHEQPQPMTYAAALRGQPAAAAVSVPRVPLVFAAPDGLLVDFTRNADRSGGLVAPRFKADGISRELGPVVTDTLPGGTDLAAALERAFKGATLFGFPLAALIDTSGSTKPNPPKIVQRWTGLETSTEMEWQALPLKAYNAFQPATAARLDLSVGSRPPARALPEAAAPPAQTCVLRNVALALPPPPAARLLTLSFGSVTFDQRPGRPTQLALDAPKIAFSGPLKLLQELQRKLEALLGAGLTCRVSPTGVTVGYEITLPKTAAGMFVMQNVAARLAVTVPYAEKPVTVTLGFASREHPFALSVTGFSGGGYASVEIAGAGEPTVEISMEFGAMVAVDFVVARAEVHALGGVRFVRRADGALELEAFIRIGGSVRLLGLVTVSVELRVALLFHDDGRPSLVGRATLVIELDLTLYSQSVTVDSGTFELVGGIDPGHTALAPEAAEARSAAAFEAWEQYRKAFAS
ncbi:hypothetical protein [Streptomyces cyanogenus]|uniref:Uncharacterized protein n=1 Tax=Streptomyces cyanogenus TaxID=80860 RepID=A0ABX7TZU6_STRCY|nr:hypothetical protein [Streptomyces cyanogenus]QTE02308.1 hypothetical protein S1361_33565 [Streptomyces cyanogenus]